MSEMKKVIKVIDFIYNGIYQYCSEKNLYCLILLFVIAISTEILFCKEFLIIANITYCKLRYYKAKMTNDKVGYKADVHF